MDHPERYPLVGQARPNKRLKLTATAVKEGRTAYKGRSKHRLTVSVQRSSTGSYAPTNVYGELNAPCWGDFKG